MQCYAFMGYVWKHALHSFHCAFWRNSKYFFDIWLISTKTTWISRESKCCYLEPKPHRSCSDVVVRGSDENNHQCASVSSCFLSFLMSFVILKMVTTFFYFSWRNIWNISGWMRSNVTFFYIVSQLGKSCFKDDSKLIQKRAEFKVLMIVSCKNGFGTIVKLGGW